MRKLIFLTLILSVNFIFSQRNIKTYIGRTEYCMYGNNPNSINFSKDEPDKKWFFEYKLKIIDDSLVYIDRCAIIKKGNHIFHSSSDGGFYFYKGTKKKTEIVATLIDCDYCAKVASSGKPIAETLVGKMIKKQITINGIKFFLIKNEKIKLFSEKY